MLDLTATTYGYLALAIFVAAYILVILEETTQLRKSMGVGFLGGIGFTMSLFIGTLAFDTTAQIDAVRVGVIAGSVIATILGLAILWMCSRKAAA